MKKYNKNLRIARNGLAAAALAAATLTFTGCLFSPPEEQPPEPAPEMTTPANVLKNIETAYNQKLIENYKKALSASFVFYFDPDDVGQKPPGKEYIIPESWSYTEDWDATENMFENAYSINLTIPTRNVGEPEPTATTFRADNVSINLLVMVDELNGYHADKGYCNFEFEKYKNQEGKDRWRLRKWWDFTAAE
ncbi:MAG: hypothetical protein GTN49_08610 [candidate division Zixibacteria bacterium]|nr:hypothetical protein [candidate division Zixibacteria bacterium]